MGAFYLKDHVLSSVVERTKKLWAMRQNLGIFDACASHDGMHSHGLMTGLS